MKSKIIGKSDIKLPYPKLMECFTCTGPETFVVLFHKEKCGMVVYSTYPPSNVGDYCEYWAMAQFKDFNGTVELSS